MSSWHALRIDHHAKDHGALLLQAVKPLVDSARRDGAHSVLVRPNWQRGPHLLLAFEMDDGTLFRENIYPRCKYALEAWLSEHPSNVILDPADYARQSGAMASAEGEVVPPDGIMPDNMVSLATLERAPPMGLPELGDIRDKFQAECLDLAFELIELRARDRAAFFLEVACMIAAVGSVAGDERYSFWPTSMLAHSDGFLASKPAAREMFERYAKQLGPSLAQRLRVLGLMDANGIADAVPTGLANWVATLKRLDARLAPIVAGNRVRLSEHDVYSGTRGAFAASWDEKKLPIRYRLLRSISRILPNSWLAAAGHLWVRRVPRAVRRAAIMNTALHLQYRIMINFIYGLLPLLGISPVERACLCYLIWDSCENYFPEEKERAERRVRELSEQAMLGNVA